ncbi:MAG TPA: Hsp20/alpha crystallin family protein [Pirellulales bacterium]|jgi:HSP20 family protein
MVRWRAHSRYPFWQLRGEVERAMGDFFGSQGASTPWTQGRVFPAVNVWEEGEQLFAEAELPGTKSEDVDVSVTGDELTIRGRRSPAAADGGAYYRRERGVGEFSRTLRLPYEVDANSVEATLRDGVLLLKLPKALSARPRKIEVQTGGQQ